MGDVIRLVIALGVTAVGLVLGPLTSAQPAKTNGTHDIPGAPQTHVAASNLAGDVAGYFFDERGGHGFVNRNGARRAVDFPGADATHPVAMNEAGAVVGTYINSQGTHGFWFKRGMFARVEFPGALSTSPLAIDDDGSIAGTYEDQDGQVHGFRLGAEGYESIDSPDAWTTYFPPSSTPPKISSSSRNGLRLDAPTLDGRIGDHSSASEEDDARWSGINS